MSASGFPLRRPAVRERHVVDVPPKRLELPPAPAVEPAPEPAPARSACRHGLCRANAAAKVALIALAVAAWAWFLLPQALGGRAAWVLVSGKSMLPRYHTGDLVLVRKQSSYRVGEVIAYRVPKGDPMAGLQVIHRIIGGDAAHGFVVQGDNRTAPDSWRPTPEDIVGAKLLRVPNGVFVIQHLRSPLFLGLLAASLAFVYVVGAGRGKDEEDAESEEPETESAEERRAA
ncbi:MAG TPA: signal peptidase I [Gaiellaceae bacterium]|nr:signal peptidase I [Gaiellaceae bacterium]